jgi:hypothetical protein
MTRAHARMLDAAEQRTNAEREVVKVQRAKEARKAAKQPATPAPAPIVLETADADLEPAAPVDELTRLAHSPRRASRHVRNRTLPPADAFTNTDLDRKLGGGSALPKLRWHP